MARYRPLLAPGRPFDLARHEYLRAIYADAWPEVVICKAGQVGISEYMISWILWSADQQQATGLYVFPTDTHVSDFSAARLGPAIEPNTSPYLAELIVPAMGDSRGADRVGLKRVGDRFIYFRGGKVSPEGKAPQLRSIDADVLVRDEVDEMDPRAAPIARERLGHSAIGWQRAASTPTFAEVGIHAEYLASDQREWHIRCGHCGTFQAPGLDNLIVEWDALDRPLRWHGQDEGAPYLACADCGRPLDRTAPGEWVAKYPSRAVHGYLVSGLFAAQKKLADILEGLQSTDETTRQQVFNQKVGLPYKSSMSESLTEAVLNAARRDYRMEPVPGEATYMGVDVGRVLNVVIRGKLPNGDRPLRHASQVASFDEVRRLALAYNVRVGVIDALPETRKVREFQRTLPRQKIWVAYYTAQKVGSKDQSPAEWDPRELAVNLDRTRAIDMTFALFHQAALRDESGEPLAGNVLPGNAQAIRDYYKQLRAPERKLIKDERGNQIAVYVETGPDHYAHAETYCTMAFLCPYIAWGRGAG